MKSFNDLADFSNEEVNALLELAARLDSHPEPEALRGKVLSLLFLSPRLTSYLLYKDGKILLFFSANAPSSIK